MRAITLVGIVALAALINSVQGQVFKPDKIFGKFSRPYTCGQCREAQMEFYRQICSISSTYSGLNDICRHGVDALLEITPAKASKLCEPFGVCQYGGNPNNAAVSCADCPASLKRAMLQTAVTFCNAYSLKYFALP